MITSTYARDPYYAHNQWYYACIAKCIIIDNSSYIIYVDMPSSPFDLYIHVMLVNTSVLYRKHKDYYLFTGSDRLCMFTNYFCDKLPESLMTLPSHSVIYNIYMYVVIYTLSIVCIKRVAQLSPKNSISDPNKKVIIIIITKIQNAVETSRSFLINHRQQP